MQFQIPAQVGKATFEDYYCQVKDWLFSMRVTMRQKVRLKMLLITIT